MNVQDINEELKIDGLYLKYVGILNSAHQYDVWSICCQDYYGVINVKGEQNLDNIHNEILQLKFELTWKKLSW